MRYILSDYVNIFQVYDLNKWAIVSLLCLEDSTDLCNRDTLTKPLDFVNTVQTFAFRVRTLALKT